MNPRKPRGGCRYYVCDEQLAAFARPSSFERLKLVDDLRRFILMTETPETAARRERQRRGEPILPDAGR